MKIAFIGAGNMASALIGGLISRGAAPGDIAAIDPGAEARAKCSATFGIDAHERIDSGLSESDVIVLAVKPQQMQATCASISPLLRGQLVISVAAGVRVRELSNWLGGHTRVVRAMPNTPALIGLGATGLLHPRKSVAMIAKTHRRFSARWALSAGSTPRTIWIR